jgi:hypothetical protein
MRTLANLALELTLRTVPGHEENERDVLRLSNDLADLYSQQGYLHCTVSSSGADGLKAQTENRAGYLTHFFMQVHSQVKWHRDYSAMAQFEQVIHHCLLQRDPGCHLSLQNLSDALAFTRHSTRKAAPLQLSVDSFRPLECGVQANISLQPTVSFTNALPFPAVITVLETWYTRGTGQQLNTQTSKPTQFASKVKHASIMANQWNMGLPQDDHKRNLLLSAFSPIHVQVRPRMQTAATAGDKSNCLTDATRLCISACPSRPCNVCPAADARVPH